MADWEEVTDPNEAKKVLGADTFARMSKASGKQAMSPQAQKFLNELSTQAAEALETSRLYDQAGGSIKQLQPGPYRGRLLEIATPEENGGFFDDLGAVVVGAPLRAVGAITPQETDAYQNLRRLQSAQVLGQQLLQKGPQTESDAARLQLTELSPKKGPGVNRDVIRSGKAKTDRVRAKSIFYTIWANKYGHNGTDPEGNTADQLWNRAADYITSRVLHGAPAKSRQRGAPVQGQVRVLSRTRVK